MEAEKWRVAMASEAGDMHCVVLLTSQQKPSITSSGRENV